MLRCRMPRQNLMHLFEVNIFLSHFNCFFTGIALNLKTRFKFFFKFLKWSYTDSCNSNIKGRNLPITLKIFLFRIKKVIK